MKTLALSLLLAGTVCAQDESEKKADTRPAIELTDAQAGELGGFVADKLDASPPAEDLRQAILEKIDALQKGTTAQKQEDPSPAKGKKKKKGGKKSKKGSKQPSSDTIKNGLNGADRTAYGRFLVTEITADHKGEAFLDAVRKELARLREERVKASSADSTKPAKKTKTSTS